MQSDIIRNTLFLVGNNVLFSCVSQFILVITPIIIYELTKSIALGSLATSLILSADMPVNYPAGRLADNIGRKKTLLLGIAIGLVGLVLMVTSRILTEYWLFWIGIVIFGFSTGFIILNRAAIMDMYPKKRGQSLGYLNTGGFIGALIAPFIIAIITGVWTGSPILSGVNYYDLILLLCIPFLAFSGLLLFGIRKDTKSIAQILRKDDFQSNIVKQGDTKEPLFHRLNIKRNLILAFLISSLSVGGVSIALSLSPTLMYILDAELWWISFSVVLISFGTSGLSIFLGKTSDKIGKKKIIIIGILLMSVGLCVLPMAQNVLLIPISNFFVGLGGGAMAIASTSMICDLTIPENRGKIFGINSLVINIFTLILPPLSATLFSLLGSFSVSLIGIVMAAVGFLSVSLLSKIN
jgi:MFS family permease